MIYVLMKIFARKSVGQFAPELLGQFNWIVQNGSFPLFQPIKHFIPDSKGENVYYMWLILYINTLLIHLSCSRVIEV